MATGKFAALAAMDTNKPRTVNRNPRRGKRSDPNYRQYTVILKHESWRQAHERMRAEEEFQRSEGRPDFSELLQSLLQKWLAEGK